MGLSNEERLGKFFWTAMEWRKRLVQLAVVAERKAPVRRWMRQLDELVGMVQHAKSGGGSYWILGEDETALRGLMMDTFSLEYRGDPVEPELPKMDSVAWHRTRLGIVEVAARLTSGKYRDSQTVCAMAAWWHAYDCVSAMAYPVFRYDDRLFSSTMKRAFRRLTGEMVNLRFEVCCGLWVGDAELEQLLLTKHEALVISFERRTRKLKESARFDFEALLAEVAAMTPKKLGEFFKAEREETYQIRRNAPRSEKLDGLRGVAAPEPESTKTAKAAKAPRGKS